MTVHSAETKWVIYDRMTEKFFTNDNAWRYITDAQLAYSEYKTYEDKSEPQQAIALLKKENFDRYRSLVVRRFTKKLHTTYCIHKF